MGLGERLSEQCPWVLDSGILTAVLSPMLVIGTFDSSSLFSLCGSL